MSRFVVEILPDAEAELRDAYLWYLEPSAMAAHAFRTEVFEAVDWLATDALTWPEDEDVFRHCILRRFPYTVHYDVQGMTVTVLAVAHHRRRPGYWHRR